MSDTPVTKSPDKLELSGKPQLSTHLNKRVVFIIFSVLAALLLIIVFNVSRPPNGSKKEEDAQSDQAETTGLQPAFNTQNKNGNYIPELPPLPNSTGGNTNNYSPPALPPTSTMPATPTGPTAEEKAVAQAMLADTEVPQFDSANNAGGANNSANSGRSPANSGRSSANVTRSLTSNWADDLGEGSEANHQGKKEDFLNRSAESQTETRAVSIKPPNSKFEIKTGTVIPAVLITEINSDLPGEIVAQVSQNVFDTATGKYLLIPQGTKLFGRYDSSIVFGQSRLLVSWNRLIYPRAETVELGGMTGHDTAGMSGFHDRVNNHYMRMIGAGLLLSIFSAGVQLSQPQPSADSNTVFFPQQTAAAAMGQQMMQLGMSIARRHLHVQPTIEIRKGYQFVVMVNKDLVFEEEYQ